MNSVPDRAAASLQTSADQLPGIDRCLQLFDEYVMLPNIREHSLMVARVADTLTSGLIASLPPQANRPDRKLVVAAALLHDIAKTECIKTGCRHAEVGQQICDDLGYPAIGAIVAEHVVLQEFMEKDYRQGNFGARELVFYADKRVLHDRVVSLDERLAYILERYGDNDPLKHQRILHYFNHSRQLETYLFSFLPYDPEQLSHIVETASSDIL